MSTLKTVTLLRVLSDDQGTLGVLLAGQTQTLYTLELPWRRNEVNLSCIPEGRYKVVWSYSRNFHRYMYEILGIPRRSGVRLHGGNLAGDKEKGFISHSRGCPLIGFRRGKMQGQRAVLASHAAVNFFEEHMQRESFMLEVENA